MTVRAKKSLGQHFLFDKNILEKMIRLGKIVPELPVLEIGPGPGELTATLLAHGCFVIAVEFDRDMIAELKKRFATELKTHQLELIHGDILKQDWKKLLAGNKPWQVIGNIPYNISTEIIFKLINHRDHCECGMFMVQKEVAERICAKAGSKAYGVLSIGVQLATHPKILFNVGRRSFVPPPKIDSSIIYMDCLEAPFPPEVHEPTMKIVRKAFQQRRKTLRNALSGLDLPAPIIGEALSTLSINPKLRPENLSIQNWVDLATQLF